MLWVVYVVFFFKKKTAYELRISDWSSDVCSSDLSAAAHCSSVRSDADCQCSPWPMLQMPRVTSATALPTVEVACMPATSTRESLAASWCVDVGGTAGGAGCGGVCGICAGAVAGTAGGGGTGVQIGREPCGGRVCLYV